VGEAEVTVWSACEFRDELDILEIRLGVLDPVVDFHVISEAPVTHSGLEKPLHFAENRDRFRRWEHKIVHVVDESPPQDVWGRERHQRQIMSDHIGAGDDDLVMIADCDEILDPDHWHLAAEIAQAGGVAVPRLDVYCLCFRWRWPETWPGGSRVVTGRTLRDGYGRDVQALFHTYNNDVEKLWAGDLSSVYGPSEPPSHGWHFSFFGGVEGAQAKMRSVAHTDYNVPPWNTREHIEACIETGKDVFDRPERQQQPAPKERLPKYVLDNWGRFSHLW